MKPQTGYSLAQEIYDIEKYPPTAKIYGWTKILEEKGYIKREKNAFVSNVKPLVDELKKILNSKNLYLAPEHLDMLGKLLDSNSFRGYVKVLLTVEKIRKNGINFLETVLRYLMTVCKYIQDKGDKLRRKDPKIFLQNMEKGKKWYGISHSVGPKWYEQYGSVIFGIDNMDIDFQKKLKIKFDRIDKFWKIIQERYEEDAETAVRNKINRIEFTRDYTLSTRVSLMAWLLPNEVLQEISLLYEIGSLFDISHILGDEYR